MGYWNVVLPFIVFSLVVCSLLFFFADDKYKENLTIRAANIVFSEHELKRRKGGVILNLVNSWLPKLESVFNLSKLIGKDIKKMLLLMDAKKSYEQVMADNIFAAIVASCMVIILPLLTGFWGYIFLAPVMFVVVMYLQAGSIHKQFKSWQNELIKDLPGLIDKMQISLEAGKPFMHTFQQVQKTVSPRLAKMLERLIIDMQSMKQSEAIDLFARSTGLPVMLKFSAAIKVGIENGYFAAENHFNMLKTDLRQLRLISLGELTKSKPEKVKKLQMLMGFHAIAALALAMYGIFKNASSVM